MKEQESDSQHDAVHDETGSDTSGGGTSKATHAPRAVLDASAILALLFGEPGAETVADVIADGAAISTVNLSEVATVLVRRGLDPDDLLGPLCEQVAVEPFSSADARFAAAASAHTAEAGLSLGDRACLALAKRLDASAMTAEHAWAQVNVGVAVQLIRRPRDHAP